MSNKVNDTLGFLMRVSFYIAGFCIIFALPNVIKYGNFNQNKANLNAAIVFIIIAVILFTVNNILSKKQA